MVGELYAQQTLRPFTTDYCTGYPEGDWKHCCLMHDMFFWAGGDHRDRDEADLGLRTCVEESGHPRQARIIYWVVRAGGHSPYRLPNKKWNNGWPGRPDYQKLSAEDVDRIEVEISHGYDFISSDIKDHFIHQLRSRLD